MADVPMEPDARSVARARRLRAAVASSALSKVSSLAYLVLAVPLILASVGPDGYSQFAVVLAAFGWLDPLFIGLGSAVTEQISSDSQRPISAQTRWTFMTALSAGRHPAGPLPARRCAVRPDPAVPRAGPIRPGAGGVLTGLIVTGGVFDSGLLGLQRSYLTNLLSFGSSLVAIAATVAAALLAPTVGAMVVATLGPVVLAKAMSGLALYRVEPGLWGARDIAWRATPRIAGRGLVFAAISFSSFLSLDAGLLVVAGRLGTTQVPAAALVIRTLPLILSIVGMITVPLWPAIAEAAETGDLRWIARAGGRVSAFVLAYAVAAALLVIVAGQTLLGLWTGHRLAMSSDILVATAGLIIMISLENVAQTVLFGLGRAGTLAVVLVSRSILSIVLVYLLAGSFGQQAALLGPLVSGLLISSWLLPVLVLRGIRTKVSGPPD